MPRLQGAVIAGAPRPCSNCPTIFTPSSVTWTKRSALASLCPRCLREKKAEKKRKKETA